MNNEARRAAAQLAGQGLDLSTAWASALARAPKLKSAFAAFESEHAKVTASNALVYG